MTPRTFHNILKGRKHQIDNQRLEWEQKQITHHELVLAVLSPHMKKAEREKAYKELYDLVEKLRPSKKPEKLKQNPKEFWENIDSKTKK